IPTLGSKFEKEYHYNKENLKTTIKDNYIIGGKKNEKGLNIPFASTNIESYYGISEEDYIQEKEESQVKNRETSETSEEVFDEWVDSNNEVQIMTVAEAN